DRYKQFSIGTLVDSNRAAVGGGNLSVAPASRVSIPVTKFWMKTDMGFGVSVLNESLNFFLVIHLRLLLNSLSMLNCTIERTNLRLCALVLLSSGFCFPQTPRTPQDRYRIDD